jgi:hypothetical protein
MSVGEQNSPHFFASRTAIEAGESTTLSWNADADAAFLSGVGKVNVADELTIRPDVTTQYVLVTEKAGAIRSASIQINVTGQKGDTFFPDPDEFRQGLRGEGKAVSYPEFLVVVSKTLQENMQFKVRGDFLPGRSFCILFTDRRPQQQLLTPEDAQSGVRQRRIAYAVQIDEPTAKARPVVIHFEVKSIIDYKRAGEGKWRPETNQQIAHRAEEALKRQLETTLGKQAK